MVESETESSEAGADYEEWEPIVLHRIETGDVRLPVMPSSATRALELASDPNLDTNDLTKLLQHDPAIAANVLRVAGSAAYGGTTEITDLSEAVNRIGTRTFCQLVSAFAIQGEVYGGSDSSKTLTDFRQHALATANIASRVARHARRDSGTAFLSGLLYNIGKPIVLHLVTDLERLLKRPATPATVNALVENFHLEMARQIFAEWDMPDIIREVCGRLASAEDEECKLRTEAAVISLADQLAPHLCGTATQPVTELENVPEAQFLEITVDDIREIVDDARSGSGT